MSPRARETIKHIWDGAGCRFFARGETLDDGGEDRGALNSLPADPALDGTPRWDRLLGTNESV